ncbi:MAG: TadE/TadG family type IV pilus assembly protein [Mycobacteriales bacterium]
MAARRSRCTGRGRDAGSFSLELAVLFPVFLLLILLIAQAALYFFARSVATSAAQQGADTARLQGNTPVDGASTATAFVTDQGGGILDDLAVTTTGSTPTQVSVTVTGHALTIIPGISFTVRQSATAPRERYTTATAAGAP